MSEVMGAERKRLPVALKIALATAALALVIPVSPIPGAPSDRVSCPEC